MASYPPGAVRLFGSKFQVNVLPRTSASSRLLLAPSRPKIRAMPAATRNPVVPLDEWVLLGAVAGSALTAAMSSVLVACVVRAFVRDAKLGCTVLKKLFEARNPGPRFAKLKLTLMVTAFVK